MYIFFYKYQCHSNTSCIQFLLHKIQVRKPSKLSRTLHIFTLYHFWNTIVCFNESLQSDFRIHSINENTALLYKRFHVKLQTNPYPANQTTYLKHALREPN